jgi:hypothetical protein
METCRKRSAGATFVVNQLTSDTLPRNLYRRTGDFLLLYEGTGPLLSMSYRHEVIVSFNLKIREFSRWISAKGARVDSRELQRFTHEKILF